MSDSIQNLQNLGLQTNEAAIYAAVLELGTATVTEISHKAGLNRTTGYDILERLSFYGLISQSTAQKKKKLYTAESPYHLKQYLENKKRTAERRLEELKNIMPELQMLYKTELKPVVRFAEGKEAMSKLYLHCLEAKNQIYSILNLKGYAEVFDELGVQQSDERWKRGIKEKVLAIKSDTAFVWYKKTYEKHIKRRKYTEYKWLEEDSGRLPIGEINIFDDKVIGMLSKPGENVAFEIQSQTFADLLKIVFELAWKNVK